MVSPHDQHPMSASHDKHRPRTRVYTEDNFRCTWLSLKHHCHRQTNKPSFSRLSDRDTPSHPCQAINSDFSGSAPPRRAEFDQITLMGGLAVAVSPSRVKKPETRHTKANERRHGVAMDRPEENSFVHLFAAVVRRKCRVRSTY